MPETDAASALRNKFLLIPYQKVSFVSPLSSQEIINRVSTRVALYRYDWENAGKFQGTWSLSKSSFRMHYMPHGSNSFIPLVSGEFRKYGSNTIITLTFNLHIAVIIIGGLWAAGWSCFAVGMASGGVMGLACFGPVVVMYLVCLLVFNQEMSRARNFLMDLFQVEAATIIPQMDS